jgi:hypothetical protein
MIPFMASGFSEHVKPDEESLRLEIIERKIMKVEDDDDSDDSEIEKLLRERHALKRKLRIRALEKELGQLNKPNKEDKEEEEEEAHA